MTPCAAELEARSAIQNARNTSYRGVACNPYWQYRGPFKVVLMLYSRRMRFGKGEDEEVRETTLSTEQSSAGHPIANSFCSSSRGIFFVSGTIVFTHRSYRHIIPVKNENT
jgi:hypothetical protein